MLSTFSTFISRCVPSIEAALASIAASICTRLGNKPITNQSIINEITVYLNHRILILGGASFTGIGVANYFGQQKNEIIELSRQNLNRQSYYPKSMEIIR